MGRVAIILQARMGSSRLPGKSMATIVGRPLVTRCLDRLGRSGLPVILATTTSPEDEVLVDQARALGIPTVRGPQDDVLARFALAGAAHRLDEIVRATADNPAVDIDAARRVLDWRRRTSADHVVEHGLPYGAAVEAMSSRALTRAAALATDARDREHVTTFMRRDPRFKALDVLAPIELRRPDLRFTVDTAEDLAFMRRLFALAEEPGQAASLETLIAAADGLRAGVEAASPEAGVR
jgi:spore coat polysaccharide biosynthesis protein SpsF (cytidylyltransferase family)